MRDCFHVLEIFAFVAPFMTVHLLLSSPQDVHSTTGVRRALQSWRLCYLIMPESASNPGQRKRRSVVKSHRGCVTCKFVVQQRSFSLLRWSSNHDLRIRHVRCDEEKPACSRCVKSGRRCDGYSCTGRRPNQHPLQIVHWQPDTLALHRLSVDIAGDREERRNFHFYRENCAAHMAGFFDSSFWSQSILQASHISASIRHAVIALGSLHQTVRHEKGTQVRNRRPCDPFALQQCNKAIGHLNQSICSNEKLSKETLLMSCAIFICFEILQENYESALSHMLGGARIFRDWQADISTGREQRAARSQQNYERVDNEIVQMYTRLNVEILLFPDTHLFPADFVKQDVQVTIDSVPLVFRTLKEARDCLDTCVGYGLQTSVAAYFNGSHPKSGRTEHARDHLLPQWAAAFEELSQTSNPCSRLKDIHAAAVLEIQYLCAQILLSLGFPPRETAFDEFRASFQKVVWLATSVIRGSSSGAVPENASYFSFETGVVPPLYFTATRCRDRQVRRQALALLSATARQEGLWNSSMMANIAERFILTEERLYSLEDTRCEGGLLEAGRLTVLNATICSEQRQVLLECCHRKAHASEGGGMRFLNEGIQY